ncbi:hypothetical protein MCOR27_001836 [Pyricularia oryzae]|uniref:Small secreted protein n=5 Tax=Pyricularia TaxID=48558 RepID=A0ABQ8NLM2_PYRGI|nr:uncharacterized protein MGG_08300 [Pyricularia oryzae 70-15]ELQ34439.1 hypothetical protein OOU_Y34scaffold00766g18 [Pyricularia oryzae Y34]KAH8836371.1 hypothetical protein MCOR01_011664 [Pyricularia oryzae]KAI6298900.1 hypothetical protein MCOR33_005087 [Pyricularia grisea]EHA55972.1 hypothetical protein MGG_08300 [Pyricularia oryzae 70-15]KAH9440013.1 hypothetical protein MCOR02_003544 [Pyricularia oryzae]
MQFSIYATTALLAIASAAPIAPRAVFTNKTYDQLSISGGKAGNAKAEALAALAGLPADKTKVERADLTFLDRVNKIANQAETQAFNPAISAASGTAKAALEAGKTKNKVLKLTATILKLEAQQAQGENVAAKLAEEQKKLDNNIAADTKRAGQASTALKFTASTA